jgi:putative endonuclease
MAQHNKTGKKGEEIALAYLMAKGYEILEKNFRYGKNEVDIIARHGDEIVFVEVKTRHDDFLVEPEMSVSRRQQRSIIKVADHYMVSRDIDQDARFDIISIVISTQGENIHHIDGAFYP